MIIVSTEAGNVEVTETNRAKGMIQVTAYAHQIGSDEIKEVKKVMEVVNYFSIDLSMLKEYPNPNRGEAEQGYAKVYRFEE